MTIRETQKLTERHRTFWSNLIYAKRITDFRIRGRSYMLPRAEVLRISKLNKLDFVRFRFNNPHLVSRRELQRLLVLSEAALWHRIGRRGRKSKCGLVPIAAYKGGALFWDLRDVLKVAEKNKWYLNDKILTELTGKSKKLEWEYLNGTESQNPSGE